METLKGGDHLEDLDVAGRIILECILGKLGGCGLDSYGSDRDQWWALVNMVMKLRVP
jgi:hypothetical protein